MRLKDLGIGRLWNEDPEILWPYGLRFLCALATYAYLAPGSRGYGLDRVPSEGGFVLAANHFAAIDHVVIGIHSPGRSSTWPRRSYSRCP